MLGKIQPSILWADFLFKIYIKGQPKLSLSAFLGWGEGVIKVKINRGNWQRNSFFWLFRVAAFSLVCRRLASVIQCSLHYTSVSRHQSAVHCCFQDFKHFLSQNNFNCRQRDLNCLHYLHFFSSVCYADNTRDVSDLTPSWHSVSCYLRVAKFTWVSQKITPVLIYSGKF